MSAILLSSVCAAAILWAEPAAADPIITPLVTAGVTALLGEALAGTAIVGGLTVGALVAGAVEIGIVAGAALLLSPKRQTKRDPSFPSQPTLQSIGPQSISPRYYAAGRVMVGGVEHFKECEDAHHSLTGVIINCEPIDGIDAWLIDGENITAWAYGPFPALTSFQNGVVVTIDCGPNTQWPAAGLKYTFQYTQRWNGSQWQPYPIGFLPAMVFDFRNGLPGGNPSPLAEHYIPSFYSSANKCCNLACVYAMATGGEVIVNRMATYPRAWPQMTWIIRGSTIYDPRVAGQTFDGSLIDIVSSREDYLAWYFTQKATWAWSRNSILVLAWYLTHYDGGRVNPRKINWASFIAEANYCDRSTPTYGDGTEAWARTDIQFHAGEEVRDVLARLQAACDATLWEDGEGLWNVWIFKHEEPTVTLTDADISAIEIEEETGALAEFNYLTPSYMEPRENYQSIPCAPIRDAESIALVGERAETVSFNEVASHNQAYRLGWRLMRRQNPRLKITITGGPSLLRCVGEKVVAVGSPATGVSGTFRFWKRSDVAPELNQITLYLALVSEDDYNDVVPPYDPVSPYETSISPIPPPIPVQTPDAPALAQVEHGGSKYILATALVGGLTPTESSLIYAVEYRRVDPATHVPISGWAPFPSIISQWVRESSPVTPTYAYEAHGYFVQNGSPSPMSASSFITIV